MKHFLFLAWQNPSTRPWFPIGKLTHDGRFYHFIYLQGAIDVRNVSIPNKMVALIASSLGLGFGKPNPYILCNPEL